MFVGSFIGTILSKECCQKSGVRKKYKKGERNIGGGGGGGVMPVT